MLTKTWFHTGVFFAETDVLSRYRDEYYQNPAFAEQHLPQPELPAGLTAQERREAARACKGIALRQETYALDGGPAVPYSVVERTSELRLLQPRGGDRPAAFLVTESEGPEPPLRA